MVENITYVICQICGAHKRELNGHIRMHSITMQNYKLSFPTAQIICQEAKELKSVGVKSSVANRPPVSAETRLKMSKSRSHRWQLLKEEMGEEKYLVMKQENAAKMRERKGANFKHSESTKQKMRGPRPHASRPKTAEEKLKCSEAAKRRPARGPHTEKTIANMKLAWVRRKSNKLTYAKYVENTRKRMTTPDAIGRIRRAVSKRLSNPIYAQKQFDTKPELKFQKFLEQANIAFTKQYIIETVNGNWTYDFYIPSLLMLVEIDGEYWHSKSLEQVNRDKIKSNVAGLAGYKLARISDKDFRPEIIFYSHQELTTHNGNMLANRYLKFIS